MKYYFLVIKLKNNIKKTKKYSMNDKIKIVVQVKIK